MWNSVSTDQFGEQTSIRYGKSKGGLVGISLSPKQVACWVLSYPLCQRVSQAFELMFESAGSKGATLTLVIKHKEEELKRRKLYAADRNLILHEFKKHINPLVDPSLELINIVNRKVNDDSINVADTLNIGEAMTRNFVNSLPESFHKTILRKVKTMETMKRGNKSRRCNDL